MYGRLSETWGRNTFLGRRDRLRQQNLPRKPISAKAEVY